MSNVTLKGVDILVPFSSDYSARFTASELSRRLRLPQQTVSRQLNRLAKANLVGFVREGKNKLFYLDGSRAATMTLLGLMEATKCLQFQLAHLPAVVVVNELLRHCESIIVFGSYAAGNFDEESDLDIVILGGCNKGAIKKVKHASPVEVNEHYAEYGEFERILRSGNPLAIEIMKNHVIFGDISKVVRIFWRNAYEKR